LQILFPRLIAFKSSIYKQFTVVIIRDYGAFLGENTDFGRCGNLNLRGAEPDLEDGRDMRLRVRRGFCLLGKVPANLVLAAGYEILPFALEPKCGSDTGTNGSSASNPGSSRLCVEKYREEKSPPASRRAVKPCNGLEPERPTEGKAAGSAVVARVSRVGSGDIPESCAERVQPGIFNERIDRGVVRVIEDV